MAKTPENTAGPPIFDGSSSDSPVLQNDSSFSNDSPSKRTLEISERSSNLKKIYETYILGEQDSPYLVHGISDFELQKNIGYGTVFKEILHCIVADVSFVYYRSISAGDPSYSFMSTTSLLYRRDILEELVRMVNDITESFAERWRIGGPRFTWEMTENPERVILFDNETEHFGRNEEGPRTRYMLNGYKKAGKSTSLILMISLHMMDMPCYQCTCDAVEKKQLQDRTEYQMICQLLYFPLEFTDSDDAGNHPLCFLFRNDCGRHVEKVADANNQKEQDTRSREKYQKLLLNFNESLTKNMDDYEKIVFYYFTAVYIDVVGNSQTDFRRNDLPTNHGRPFGEILELLRQSLRLENRHTPFVIASSSYGSQRLKDEFSKALGKPGSGNFRSVTLPVWKLEHLKNTDGTLNEAGRKFCGLERTTDNICNECLYTITEKVSANPHMLQSLLCENENPSELYFQIQVKDSFCIMRKYHFGNGSSLLKSAIEAKMSSIVDKTLKCLRFNFFWQK